MAVVHMLRTRWGARVLATLALVLLQTGAPPALAGQPRAAAKPRSGGAITIRAAAAPTCLDSYKTAGGYDVYMNMPVWDTLLSLNDKGKVVPYLAQKYTVSKDGKTITFYLRHDVKYSNGHPLVAGDVKKDFERVLNPATKSQYFESLLTGITRIDTPGKYIVRLTLSAPSRPLLVNLAVVGIMDPKSVAAAGSNTCDGLVGSGPFRISSVGPGYATVKEVRNPLHTFGPSWAHNKGPAYLSSLTWVPITSNTTAVSELLAGQLDVTDVPGDELSRVQGNNTIKLHYGTSQIEVSLLFNSGRAPFNNVAVRRAVAEAIDRKAVLTAATQGLAKVSTSPLPPGIYGYDPGSAKYAPKLDLSAARAAIAAAHATGPYTLVTPSTFGTDAAAEVIQGELAQVGMQVNVENKSQSDWLAELGKEDFDLGMLTHGSGPGDPDVLYAIFHSSQLHGGFNFTNMTDPTLDKLLVAGRTTLNLQKARGDYYAAQKLVDTKVYVDPLYVPVNIIAVRSRVQGWHTGGLQKQPLWQDLWVK